MSETPSGAPKSRLADHLWLLGILIGVGVVYFVAAGQWGLWEPWETEFARMGRSMAASPDGFMNPIDGDANPVNKPWLVALLLEWGYRLDRDPSILLRAPFDAIFLLLIVPVTGLVRRRTSLNVAVTVGTLAALVAIGATRLATPSTEFWLRAPFAGLGLITVVAAYALTRQFASAHRAGLVALVLASSPLFLMSSVNLAGAIPAIATTTLALAAAFLGLRQGRVIWWAAAGLLTGLSVWADGVTGAVLVLGTLGAYGVWSIAQEPKRLLRPLPLFVATAVAALTLGYPLQKWLSLGFDEAKDTVGVFLPLGIAITACTAGYFSSAFGKLNRWGLLAFGVGFAVLVGVLVGRVRVLRGDDNLFSFLLYNEFLNRRTLPDHVSFDTLIRQLGFAAYPYTVFLPLGLAYLFQTVGRDGDDTTASESDDRGNDGLRELKALAVCWFAVGFGLVGVASTLSGQYLFTAMVPIALAVGLLFTDGGYWQGLRQRRTHLYLIGFGCLAILMVLTKDLKTHANPELGQLGPEVLFEFLVVDGRQEFPDDFKLAGVSGFRLLWAGFIALYFWLLLSWVSGLPDRLDKTGTDETPRSKPSGGPLRRLLSATVGGLRTVGVMIGYSIATVIRPLRPVIEPLRRFVESPTRFAALLVGSVVVFAGLTAGAYLPRLSDHLSNRGLIDTYQRLADDGEVFYRVGGARSNTSYYLGEETITTGAGHVNPIETLRSTTELRRFFCDAQAERMFAMVDRDALAAAYYEVRHGDRARRRGRGDEDDNDCNPDRDLMVLDARSSRYVLVSNRLEEGEQNVNPLAEHIFEELPDDVTPVTPQYTFDGKFKIIGYRIYDEDGNLTDTAAARDKIYLETFYEVMERAPSARQMFIHVDYRNQRINGDHDPVDGEFPINYWVPGEIVRDRYEMTIDPGSATGDYSILLGFFSGDNRMQTRPATGDNRVNIGMIHIEGGI